MSDELLDVLDELGRPIGAAPRSVVHQDGLWHQVFHCLVVARRPTGPAVILQRRARAKAAFPGLLDLSATGHVGAGEQPIDGRRELAEELGIEVEPDRLVPLGTRRMVSEEAEGSIDRELTHVYLVRDDRPLDEYQPAPAEVSELVELTIEVALGLFEDPGASRPGETWNGQDRSQAPIGVADFIPGDRYWITLLVMADRLARGMLPVAI